MPQIKPLAIIITGQHSSDVVIFQISLVFANQYQILQICKNKMVDLR